MANMMKRVPVAEQEPKVRAKNFERYAWDTAMQRLRKRQTVV